MTLRLASAIIATAALTALTACGPTVSIQRTPDARIAAGATWAWGPPDRDGIAVRDGARIPADSIARVISDAVESELRAKGFRRTEPDSAQFIVHFHTAMRDVSDTTPGRGDSRPGGVRAPGNWGGEYGYPEELDARVVTWKEGLLIVDALDAERGIVVWRGAISGEVPERAETRPAPAIREAVRRLLRDFP